MTDYNYIFGSLRSEKVIAEIPLFGTYMDLELNVGGRFDGSFSLDMTGYSNQVLLDATTPGATWVVVERNGIPIWSGYVWSRTYQSQAKNMQLYAESFEKYPTRQRIVSDVDIFGFDQRNAFRQLWTHMMSVPGRDVNVRVPDAFSPGVIGKNVEVLAVDYKFYAEVMSAIADSADGFDWYIETTHDPYQPWLYARTLKIGYPVLGTTRDAPVIFDYPGSILNYYATESMANAGTNVLTLGSGEGSAALVYETNQSVQVDSGFPRWDVVVSRKDIDSQQQLNTYGQAEGAARKPPMLVVKPSMKGSLTPEFGSFALGDSATVAIVDSRFPTGYNFQSRIVKWSLRPQSADNTEEYAVLFENDDEGED